MTEPKPHRRRRWQFALLALVVLGGIGALLLRHYTRPEKLTALLVEQTHSLLGADLAMDGVAHFGFVPNLHLVLPHPALKAPGANAAFLTADSLEAVVPWRTLWADRYDIRRIDLAKPVLDLDAFSAWLAARPPSSTPPPDVRFTLRVVDGTVTSAGKATAQGLNMAFANSGDLAAWLANAGSAPTPAIPPLTGSADAAMLQFGDTRLDDVHIEIQGQDAKPTRGKQP